MKALVLSLGLAAGLLVSGGVASAQSPRGHHHGGHGSGHHHHGHHGNHHHHKHHHHHGGWHRPPYYPPVYPLPRPTPPWWGYKPGLGYPPGWYFIQSDPYPVW